MASEGTAGTESRASNVERNQAAEAANHLIQGKRHLLVQDIPSAVASLQEACKLMVECHGELDDKCGDAYFYYGKALLELARDEAGVFGTVLEEDKEDEDAEIGENNNEESEAEEESDESDDASDGSKESEVTNQAGGMSTVQEVVEISDEKTDSSKEVNFLGTKPSSCAAVFGQPGPSADACKAEAKEEDEEVTNLQLAWETLELAKIIFQRQSDGDRDSLLKLAEVHLHLGEVGLESENYSQAVEDMQTCLAIRQELLDQNDRLLAETHYQLGLALCFDNIFDDAIKHFQSAVGVIKDRITHLKRKRESKSESKTNRDRSSNDEESIEGIKREIEDLEEILPEIEEKVTDTEDMKKNTADKLREAALRTGFLSQDKESVPCAFAEPSLQSESSFSGLSSEKVPKPIATINHLVKRKRKLEEDNMATTSLEKKTCHDGLDDRYISSSSTHELLSSQHNVMVSTAKIAQQICGAISAKNESDVSSTTLLSSEEKSQLQGQCNSVFVDNEATEIISSVMKSKATVCENRSIQDLSDGETLANGSDTKKVVSSDSTQENIVKSSNN